MDLQHATRRLIARLVLGYCLVAGLWIVVSDQLLSLFGDIAEMTYLATVKGLVFVTFSSFFLYLALGLVARQGSAASDMPAAGGLADSASAAPFAPIQGYVLAVLLTGMTFLLRFALEIPLSRPMLILFMLPITLSALLGGAGPGVLATALTIVGQATFVLRGYVPESFDVRIMNFQLFILAASGVVVSLVSHALHRSRQRAELALRRERDARDEYRILSDQLRDPVWRKDRDGRYIDCNQPFLTLTNRKREQIIGRTDEELFNSTVAAEWRAEDLRVIDTLQAVEQEEHWPPPSTAGWVLVSKSPVMDAHGQCVGSIGIARDINRRREAEQALKESEALFRTLFDIGQDAVLIGTATRDGRMHGFIEINAEAARMFGYERIRLLGMSLTDLLSDEARELSAALLEAVLRDGSAQCVTTARTADGRRFLIELSITRFQVRRVGEVGVMMAMRDISVRVAGEAEQARLREQVAHMQKLEAIGQLTGGISHDFNNLLATVLGYTELAAQHSAGLADAKLEQYLDAVRTAALRGRDLVSKMLVFSRGRAVASAAPTAVAPRAVVEGALQLLRSAIPSSIEMEVALEDLSGGVACDAVEIEQLLMNLVINARDAITGAGRIDIALREITITREACSACLSDYSGEYIELLVSDSGAGISPHLLPNIFEPFFTTKEVGKGTGLGLALVHGIVHKAGGHIQIGDAAAGGAQVSVRLPKVGLNAVADGQNFVARADGVSPASQVGAHVMVVDDEAPLGRYWQDLLEGEGYRVSVFNDSRAALERFTAAPHEVDAVLSDVTMPHVSGEQLAQAMLARRGDLPVFLLSGNLSAFDERGGASPGVRQRFKKPVNSAEVLAALSAALV